MAGSENAYTRVPFLLNVFNFSLSFYLPQVVSE